MSHTFPMYEGDSTIRLGLSQRSSSELGASDPRLLLEELGRLEREAHRRRNQAISDFFAGAVRWIVEAPARARQRSMDARVGNPSDMADLEYRLRSLERGDHAKFA